ncbi:MAG: PKD domain-containing protein [Promethearchaeota archaeon]
MDLELYDDQGNILASSWSITDDEEIQWLTEYTGDYYLHIFRIGTESGQNYDLDILIDETYASVLDYGDYISNYGWANGGDIKNWNFEGTNSHIGVIVRIMDSANYNNFQNSLTYSYYEVSDGSYYGDSGEFTVPYQDTWYTVFFNYDPDQQTTIITRQVSTVDNGVGGSLLESAHYIYQHSIETFDIGDTVDWDFLGTNPFVGITVLAMTEDQFQNFQDADPYTSYTLSDGTFISDSGEFIIPEQSIWYFVFWNDDLDGYSTDIVYNIEYTANLLPTASFSVSNSSVNVNDSVDFTDTSFGGDSPLSYLWNFGDDTTSTLQNPTHVYTTSGTYTVSLTVTDANGDFDIYTMNIVVIIPATTTTTTSTTSTETTPNIPTDTSNLRIPGFSTGILMFSAGLMFFIIWIRKLR